MPTRRPSARAAACSSRRAVVAGQAERLLERLGEVAAVVGHPAGRLEGVGLARDEVAPADLDGVDAEPLGELIEQALHHEGAHRHAHSAIGPERRLVRLHRDRLVGVDLGAVGPRQDRRRAERLQRGGERIDVVGAVVGHDARAQPPHNPVGVGGQLDVHPLLAGMAARREVLAPLLDPLHRTAEPAGQRGHRDVLGEHVDLETEAAADVGDDDPHARGGQAERRRQRTAQDRGRLGGGPHGQASRRPSRRRRRAAPAAPPRSGRA